MGWIYSDKELKTKQDYIHLLNEIEAYRKLDGQDFNFGTGVIVNEMSYGSEDAYYEIDIEFLEETIKYWEYNKQKSAKRQKVKPHGRYYKRKKKNKIKRLKEISWWSVRDREEWSQRRYRGNISSYLKKRSNKIIRRYKGELSLKGNNFHKVFDYWWKLY